MKYYKIFITTWILFFAGICNAIIIDQGSTTLDSDTTLEWLDMSFTDGVSYSVVESNLNSYDGGGWRFAQASDFETFISNALGGLTPIYGSSTTTFSEMYLLSGLMGSTYTGGYYGFTVGNLIRPTSTTFDRAQFGWHNGSGYIRESSDIVWDGSRDPSQDIGSFLVRGTTATVPEPTGFALLGLGLVGIFFARRRRQS